MRFASPQKLWLLGICLLPGTAVVAAGMFRPSPARPKHQHEWRPYRSPGGVMRLVDARGRPVTHLLPGQIARIECLPIQDMDRCRRPDDCTFPPEGIVVERTGPRVLEFSDGDGGGEFGRVTGGRFRTVPPEERGWVTHYRASGGRWGTFPFTARFDDTTYAEEDDGAPVTTYDDPAQETSPLWITVGPKR